MSNRRRPMAEPGLHLRGDGSGRVDPPFPTTHCVGTGCGKPLMRAAAAYLFTDGEGAFAILCDDCALDLRLKHHRGEGATWKLVLTL